MSKSRRAGFSLIEVVVVLGVLGIVTGIGSVMFAKMMTLRTTMLTRAELDRRVDKAFEQVRKDFTSTISPDLALMSLIGVSAYTQESVPNADDRVIITVYNPTPEGGTTGLAVMYYVNRTAPGGPVLVRVPVDVHKGAPVGSEMPVLEGVQRIDIQYQTDEGEWVDEWTDTALPKAARVSLVVRDPNRPDAEVVRAAMFPIFVS
jgi:prepilin-type N-terminal cleavage/methylation domain-containing protein